MTYRIVGDRAEENTSQKDDGHIGRIFHVYEINFRLTTLSGKLLMCCVIFNSVKYCSETETGIDFTINSPGSSNNQQEFIGNNLEYRKDSFEPFVGIGKTFPGRIICIFKDTVVPCFTRWSEYGGMTSNILKKIVELLTILIF